MTDEEQIEFFGPAKHVKIQEDIIRGLNERLRVVELRLLEKG